MTKKLLTRTEFREGVFARDGHKCVVCKREGKDAHHIIERRLFSDGGYYLDNGATLCEEHHLAAEATTLSCAELRRLAGIERIVLPEHLYDDEIYDKWGNIILPNGTRLRGELFDDENVQKVLAPVLSLFVRRVKYPRTYHLPWSPGRTKDDRTIESEKSFREANRLIVHVKMDGENTTIYSDGFVHARSVEPLASHPSRTRVKQLAARVAYELPEGWRICAENLQGRHSIHYKHLRDWVYGISIWDEQNQCLPWSETREWFRLLDITPCPVLYEGPFDGVNWFEDLYQPTFEGDECEGYVVRVEGSFLYREYRRAVAKYVRKGHVQTHAHWMQTFVENQLKEGK